MCNFVVILYRRLMQNNWKIVEIFIAVTVALAVSKCDDT
jgi:hypothetical protein